MFYLECGCDTYGASSNLCSLTGICACRTGYANTKCSECQDKYYREGHFCVGNSFCFCGFFKSTWLRVVYLPDDQLYTLETKLSNDCYYQDCNGIALFVHFTCEDCIECSGYIGDLDDGQSFVNNITNMQTADGNECTLYSLYNLRVIFNSFDYVKFFV